jgi:hypothetical protein
LTFANFIYSTAAYITPFKTVSGLLDKTRGKKMSSFIKLKMASSPVFLSNKPGTEFLDLFHHMILQLHLLKQINNRIFKDF